ncbi:hypothetical protein ACEQPO_23810 [Bacillus sp. SL00103]
MLQDLISLKRQSESVFNEFPKRSMSNLY